MSKDTIYRQAAIDAMVNELSYLPITTETAYAIVEVLNDLPSAESESCAYWDRESNICALHRPSAQPEKKPGKWTIEEVAELLATLFGDECACNYNGIDEWLPERCKYTEIADECPNPKEKHGCWMQFLLQGGADMREKDNTFKSVIQEIKKPVESALEKIGDCIRNIEKEVEE